jgi:GTP pyrophosphokinase
MMTRYPYRMVVARWTKTKSSTSFIANVKITGLEDIGIVNKIADILSGYNVNIRSFSYNINEGMFEGILNIMVPNNDVLYGIIRKIHSIKGVTKAARQHS